MNSISHLPGSSFLSAFRRDRLLQRFKQLDLPISDIQGFYDYYLWTTDAEFTAEDDKNVRALLDDGRPAYNEASLTSNALILGVVPRIGTVSPWASKATDIVKN